eukprot:5526019-Amphidinium_carterae.1
MLQPLLPKPGGIILSKLVSYAIIEVEKPLRFVHVEPSVLKEQGNTYCLVLKEEEVTKPCGWKARSQRSL